MDDTFFMNKALALARKGAGYTSPNPMVGAVVVKNGKILGSGWHPFVGGPHAEVKAIDDAGEKANGADIYVTLEPCNHHGRTPPCTEKILKSGIKRVVMAMPDPNPDVTGGGAAYLEENGVKVDTGVCEAEALALNEAFVKFVKTGRPFVTLKCAATLDGRIATSTGDSKWVTGPEARAFVHEIRHDVDAIMVGRGTLSSDDPSLTTRREGKAGKDPARIILDTRLSISEKAKVLTQKSEASTCIITGPDVDDEKRRAVLAAGGKIMEVKQTPEGGIDLGDLMGRLGKERITSLLIEGGATVVKSALATGIVDKVIFFYAPKILGGDDGVPMVKGRGPLLMKDSIQIQKIDVKRFGNDVMIQGYIAD